MDVKTLITVLFWGNLTAAFIVAIYWVSNNIERNKNIKYFFISKLFQSIAYVFLGNRDILNEFVSVNLGNTMLMMGFYMEAIFMLCLSGTMQKKTVRTLLVILFVCIGSFNIIELVHPDSSIRIVIASFCIFSIMLIPNVKLYKSQNISIFKKYISVFYILFLALLLPRAIYAIFYPVNILSGYIFQEITFLSLVILMIFNLSAYLLLNKEDRDRALNQMATTDSLTQLPNRYSFIGAASHVFRMQAQFKKSLSMIFIDIDHFKMINDKYGHDFGDTVLKAMGKILVNSIRESDHVCRYGGEEFVVLLTRANETAALCIVDRIMQNVKAEKFEEYPEFTFTVSAGIASGAPTSAKALNEYIKNADMAMYEAKQNGRNRAVVYRPRTSDS